ncbi:MAG: nitrophenyl compound nitroreductase subunit ArsF family protein [Candidatus Sumerlaeia bacterium]|nr:nitrophenyl compound nitroreductase subunit ArsF family protein [Candidatus Sumerlaeia bacterium]
MYKEININLARQKMAVNSGRKEVIPAITPAIPPMAVTNLMNSPIFNLPSKNDTNTTSPTITQANVDWVIVYYFHGTVRCTACINVEFYTNEVLETYFAKELQNGKLQFATFNVDELQNQHYIKEFQLVSNSLVIALYKGKKLIKHKTLADVWEYQRNKEKCMQYIKAEIEKILLEAN